MGKKEQQFVLQHPHRVAHNPVDSPKGFSVFFWSQWLLYQVL